MCNEIKLYKMNERDLWPRKQESRYVNTQPKGGRGSQKGLLRGSRFNATSKQL